MNTHEWITTILGLILVVGSPIAWKKWEIDGFVALVVFFIGLSIVVTGKLF